MKYHIGDKVEVISKLSDFKGHTGVIINVTKTMSEVMIIVERKAFRNWYGDASIKPVKQLKERAGSL